jgi:hypothetical protein
MSLMHANASLLSLTGLLLGVAVAVLPAPAASNLLENSPFLPTNIASGAAQEAAPLQLRSILKEGADYEFSLYDPAKKLSTWARLDEPGHDFMVKAFDQGKETVTVERGGRTYKLALKESKIIQLASAPGPSPLIAGMPPGGNQGISPTMSPPNPAGPFPFGNRNQSGPMPSLTPEQLRNLEADINRRRELRRQAAAAQSAMSPPGQPPGQPQQH